METNSAIKGSAWYEQSSREFLEEDETVAAFEILDLIAELGLTQEKAVRATKRAYALSILDCKQSEKETLFTVHLDKEDVDYLEYLNIEKTIP